MPAINSVPRPPRQITPKKRSWLRAVAACWSTKTSSPKTTRRRVIFNNAARNDVSFKDYGALIRITGTDTGTSTPTALNDPKSGYLGYPVLNADGTITDPLGNAGDVDSSTSGLGQTYFLSLPVLAILGDNNTNGEPHLDKNYPGYNFNISDQRRALEFIRDFDRMIEKSTLPQFLYIYLPNDHTGSVQAPNASAVIPDNALRGAQQVADNDVALGMVVNHIMQSPIYYNRASGEGCAIFITEDDAQSSVDHIHPHRTPLTVVSPYAKPGYVAKKHYGHGFHRQDGRTAAGTAAHESRRPVSH